MSSSTAVLVLGGGLAGAAAAIVLARAGHEVTLIERDAGPRHKVCGEFLSGEALHLLHLLGVDAARLGAVPIRGVRFCPGEGFSSATLPFPAMSLTRRTLDPALLEQARASGAVVRTGVAVQALERVDDLWCAKLSDETECVARNIVLATGKHDLRGYPRPAGAQSDLVGIKMYLRLSEAEYRALGAQVELLLYPGGYAGLQPVEDGVANLCCLVHRDALTKAGGGWEGLLGLITQANSHARARLRDATPTLGRVLAVAPIPYGFVRSKALAERVWAVGDQAAVIPSFTGDGMSIALMSGVRAAESLLRGESAAVYQGHLYADLRWQVRRATAVSRGLVWSPAKKAIAAAVWIFPTLLRGTARATRLSEASMRAVGGPAVAK